MLLRNVNRVRLQCDCARQVDLDAEASVGFMGALYSVAQQYRPTMDWQCACGLKHVIDKQRAQTFMRVWVV